MNVQKESAWRYALNCNKPDWFTTSYDDSSWLTITGGNIVHGFSSSIYYRLTFSNRYASAAYELSLLFQQGLIAYLNGIEVVREHMPPG